LQVLVQPPAAQPAVACGSVATHECPQVPQLVTSVDSFTQVPPHRVVGAAHVDAHTPAPLQVVPMGHTLVHDPQWLLSLASFTQIDPQRVSPAPHTHGPHWQLEEQVAVPVDPHACVAEGEHTP
jgi:hypothetical protein